MWFPCLWALFLRSCGMRDTIKMYLFASSIPFFFPCSDITTYFMTALSLSLFYSQKNQSPSPNSVCHKSIDKISIIEIPMVQAESGLQLSWESSQTRLCLVSAWHLFFHFSSVPGQESSVAQLHDMWAIQTTDALWKQPEAIREEIIQVSNRGETDVSVHSPVRRITSFIKRALAQFLNGTMSGRVWCPSISEELHTKAGFITHHFFLFVKPIDFALYPGLHLRRKFI